MHTGVGSLNHAIEQTQPWITDVARAMAGGGSEPDREAATTALRAVLAATRDNLVVDEAADFAAQLPTIVRGLYYQGWKPSETPAKDRSRTAFLDRVAAYLANEAIDPEAASRAVFAVLCERMPGGEPAQVRNMLTAEVKAMWPDGVNGGTQ